jgi:hypothetical protein
MSGYNPRRKTEKLVNGHWQPIAGLDILKQGDVFRMFESNGQLVVDAQTGESSFLVARGPVSNSKNVTKVECVPRKEGKLFINRTMSDIS